MLKSICVNLLFLLIIISWNSFAKDNLLVHKDIVFNLPPGWEISQPPYHSAKRLGAVIKSTNNSETFVSIESFSSWKSLNDVWNIGADRINKKYSNSKEMRKKFRKLKPKKFKTENRLKVKMKMVKGFNTQGEGQKLFYIMMAVMRLDPNWILFIGTTPDETGDSLKEDLMKILNSSRKDYRLAEEYKNR